MKAPAETHARPRHRQENHLYLVWTLRPHQSGCLAVVHLFAGNICLLLQEKMNECRNGAINRQQWGSFAILREGHYYKGRKAATNHILSSFSFAVSISATFIQPGGRRVKLNLTEMWGLVGMCFPSCGQRKTGAKAACWRSRLLSNRGDLCDRIKAACTAGARSTTWWTFSLYSLPQAPKPQSHSTGTSAPPLTSKRDQAQQKNIFPTLGFASNSLYAPDLCHMWAAN